MVVKNIHIIESHAFQALVKTRHQILSGSPVAIRARPHIIAGFCGDHKLIAVCTEAVLQRLAKVFLRKSIRRMTVVIREVKVCDPAVKRMAQDLFLVCDRLFQSKILPQSQRDPREF